MRLVLRVATKVARVVCNIRDKLNEQEIVYQKNMLREMAEAPPVGSCLYLDALAEYTRLGFNDCNLMSIFERADLESLPNFYGVGFDERAVEWPWVLAHIQSQDKRILDAGSATNHSHILELPLWDERHLDIVTLSPEKYCAWQRGISYLYDDIRSLAYKDCVFDLVLSISTLEHIGMNNLDYKNSSDYAQHSLTDVFDAFGELKRVLKPGGRILFTVPYGCYEDHGSFQQFDARLLEVCKEKFTPSRAEDVFFKYSIDGWQVVSARACEKVRYAIEAHSVSVPDKAAGARAVACCQWWK